MASNAEAGTSRSGYLPEKYAPFQCLSCAHLHFPKQCDHPDVIADAKNQEMGLKIHKGGMAVVDLGGCCSYWREK